MSVETIAKREATRPNHSRVDKPWYDQCVDYHALIVTTGKGLLMGVGPAIAGDIRTIYAWANQDKLTFAQVFDWRIALKKLLAGAIGGVAGVFGFALIGVNL